VAEIEVTDKQGYEENFFKATAKDISNHGGSYGNETKEAEYYFELHGAATLAEAHCSGQEP
jgi:hypothetical protein